LPFVGGEGNDAYTYTGGSAAKEKGRRFGEPSDLRRRELRGVAQEHTPHLHGIPLFSSARAMSGVVERGRNGVE
jgi:hypothetical protein